MKFAVEVGETEKNRLECSFNQLLGTWLVTVNEKPAVRSVRLLNEPLLEVRVFVVGDQQPSTVRIEKQRKQLVGHTNRVYLNNRLLRLFDG